MQLVNKKQRPQGHFILQTVSVLPPPGLLCHLARAESMAAMSRSYLRYSSIFFFLHIAWPTGKRSSYFAV